MIFGGDDLWWWFVPFFQVSEKQIQVTCGRHLRRFIFGSHLVSWTLSSDARSGEWMDFSVSEAITASDLQRVLQREAIGEIFVKNRSSKLGMSWLVVCKILMWQLEVWWKVHKILHLKVLVLAVPHCNSIIHMAFLVHWPSVGPRIPKMVYLIMVTNPLKLRFGMDPYQQNSNSQKKTQFSPN